MPQTYRDYTPLDIALRVHYTNESRAKLGDIAAAVPMRTRLGSKELHRFVWLRVYGLDWYEMRALQATVDEPVLYEKRRYCVPLGRLKQVYPAFDIAKATDENVIYQPFLMVDEETYHIRAKGSSIFPVHGLIRDRLTMRFL